MTRRNLSYDDGMMIWKTEDDYRWLKRMRSLVAATKILTYVIQSFLALMTLSALHDGFWAGGGDGGMASAMVGFVRWAKVRYYHAERERLRDATSAGAAPYHHDKKRGRDATDTDDPCASPARWAEWLYDRHVRLGRPQYCGAGLSRRETGCGGTLYPGALRRRGMPTRSDGVWACFSAGARWRGPGDSCL